MTETSSGSKAWELKAPLAKAALSGEADLSQPAMTLYRAGKPASRTRSQKAHVHGDSKDVTLTGNVVVISEQDKSVLRTELLEYHTKIKRYTTDAAVTLERSGSVTHGKGMDADSELNEINIYHQETTLQ